MCVLGVQAVFDDYEEGDVVWCQDYHLMLLPALLKARYPKMKVTTTYHPLFHLPLGLQVRAGYTVESTPEIQPMHGVAVDCQHVKGMSGTIKIACHTC